jgi:hypothetical protein
MRRRSSPHPSIPRIENYYCIHRARPQTLEQNKKLKEKKKVGTGANLAMATATATGKKGAREKSEEKLVGARRAPAPILRSGRRDWARGKLPARNRGGEKKKGNPGIKFN